MPRGRPREPVDAVAGLQAQVDALTVIVWEHDTALKGLEERVQGLERAAGGPEEQSPAAAEATSVNAVSHAPTSGSADDRAARGEEAP